MDSKFKIWAIISFIGYIILVLYKHFRYLDNEFYYYHQSEAEVIFSSSIIYILIVASIFIVYKMLDDYYDLDTLFFNANKQESSIVEIKSNKEYIEEKSKELIHEEKENNSNSCNKILLVCSILWIVHNIIKIATNVQLIQYDDDISKIAKYNIFIGLLLIVSNVGIIRGSKYALFGFIFIQLFNGAANASEDNDSIHLLISLVLIIIMLLLLLLKNKHGKNGYNIMFNK